MKRFFLIQWLILGLALLILGGYVAISLQEEHNKIEATAQERLSLGAKSIALDVERRLASIDTALLDLRKNLPSLQAEQNGQGLIAMYLQSIQNGVDGVRTAMIFDAQGTVTASSRAGLVGMNFRQREYFQSVLNKPDAHTLYVPAPFITVLYTYSLNVMHATFDAQGEFSGIVSATLDPDDFEPMLAAQRYTPDVSVGLIHGSGKVLLYLSSPEVPPGTDVSDPAPFFARHLQSGKEHSQLSGFAPVLPNERLAAVHTINPPALYMNAPLVVVISQEVKSILAPWYDKVWTQGTFLVLLALLASFTLLLHQRRQRKLASLSFKHQTERQHDADRLKLATEASGTGVWEFDLKSKVLTWDNNMFRLFGRDRENFSADYTAWQESVLPEDLPAAEAALQQAIDHDLAFDELFRIRRGDGEIRVIDALARVYRDDAGQPARMIGVNRDITQRVQTEQDLRKSKDLNISILHSLVQHIAVLDAHGVIVTVNQAWRDFARDNGATGRTVESVGLNYLDICSVAPAYDSGTEALPVLVGIRAVLAGTQAEFSLEYPCHSPSEERWFLMHVTPLRGSFPGVVVAHENITERKLAEEKVHSAQRLTQQFIDHLPGTAYVKDENLRVLMANKAFQQMLGLDPASMIGKTSSELFPSNFAKKLDADDRQILESGSSTVVEEDFEGRYFESSKFVIEGDAGKSLLGGITMEVTQRQKNNERQQALIRISELGGTLPEQEFLKRGIEIAERLTASRIGYLHLVNDDQQSVELVTWTAGAVAGCSALHDTHYPLVEAGIWADCIRNNKISVFNDNPGHDAWKGLPTGHAILQRLISVPVIEENKVRLILVVGNKPADYDEMDCVTLQLIGNDLWRIIRRVRAEAALKQKLAELIELNSRLEETNNKLLQSEKLASIGQLAAGVAHEINNPIGYVSSNLNALTGYVNDLLAIDAAYGEAERRCAQSMPQAFERAHQLKAQSDYSFIVSDIHHLLGESREGLDRVSKIVKDLKDFSRVGGTGWQRVNLHDGLESTLNIVWNEIKYKAEVDREYGELPEICCIPSQINQVFMNLLTNAAQSIEAYGHIVLRSGRDGDTVWVEVQDDGAGIAAENLEHIFEPFYTTKAVGKGTGLGLSLSWGIIQRHRGRIEVRSALGKGTTFRVILPIDRKPETENTLEIAS